MKYTEDNITISEEQVTGQIFEFPLEIVSRMVQNAKLQGNSCDVSLKTFRRDKVASKAQGGFNWSNSTEEHPFWSSIINDRNFNKYFEKYPECKGTYIIEESDKFGWIKPSMPDELVQLVIRTAIIQNKRNQLAGTSIMSCFIWSNTTQGNEFWKKIYKGIIPHLNHL